MLDVEVLGGVAAVLTTCSFLPQAVRVIRTRDTGAISLTMYAMFTLGVALWGVYGLITWRVSIIAANAVTVCLASLILAMKVRDVMKRKTHAG